MTDDTPRDLIAEALERVVAGVEVATAAGHWLPGYAAAADLATLRAALEQADERLRGVEEALERAHRGLDAVHEAVEQHVDDARSRNLVFEAIHLYLPTDEERATLGGEPR